MITIYIFTISGLAIVVLVAVKKIEEKRKKPLFISNAISKGDAHIRKIYHRAVHFYTEGKENTTFIVRKRIPLHLKNSLNKLITYLKERRSQYLSDMRDSKLLRKSGGISEFFKSMSNIKKGDGEINDIYVESSQTAEKSVE